MKAPRKADLVKALQLVGQAADTAVNVAADAVPRSGPRLRPDEVRAVLVQALVRIRTLAHAATGEAGRWDRRPTLEPLVPELVPEPAILDTQERKGRAR